MEITNSFKLLLVMIQTTYTIANDKLIYIYVYLRYMNKIAICMFSWTLMKTE